VTVISQGGGFSDADLKDAAVCFGYRAPDVDLVLGDGIPSPIVSDSAETHLDLQTVSGVLRDATRIRLVQTVNDNDSMVDAYARALRANTAGTLSPDVISLSYGACEVADTRGNSPLRSALEALFRMAALVGTSVVASTGDQGSSVCQIADPQGLGLDPMGTISYPASSPFMTAVGGTRLVLNADNTRADEVVWNDQPYGVPGAGTGGASRLFAQPWYQSGVTGSLARTVPDLSALAAIQPGWPVVYGGGLIRVGGTSGATPFVGANLAMIAGQQRRAGEPSLGFVNPWLYLVQARHPSAFFDVTSGDNQIAVRVPGGLLNFPACCEAAPGYDMASGLGAPNIARLAARVGLRP
jgi:subtilase family serine protease